MNNLKYKLQVRRIRCGVGEELLIRGLAELVKLAKWCIRTVVEAITGSDGFEILVASGILIDWEGIAERFTPQVSFFFIGSLLQCHFRFDSITSAKLSSSGIFLEFQPWCTDRAIGF